MNSLQETLRNNHRRRVRFAAVDSLTKEIVKVSADHPQIVPLVFTKNVTRRGMGTMQSVILFRVVVRGDQRMAIRKSVVPPAYSGNVYYLSIDGVISYRHEERRSNSKVATLPLEVNEEGEIDDESLCFFVSALEGVRADVLKRVPRPRLQPISR